MVKIKNIFSSRIPILLSVVLFFVLPMMAHADSSGPNSASTGADDAGTGSVTWTSPENITTSDNIGAGAGLTSLNTTSHYLKATNFGFSIPSGATINGIVVEWERKDNDIMGANSKDNAVRIVKGGTIGATDKSSASTWPASDAYASYGSSSDLWGETWTVSDINASTFGAALSAISVISANSAAPTVDHVRITVYYTGAPANAYWVGGTGNWSDATNHWAATSGGAAGAGNLPGSTTNVFFDSNSGSGTVTLDTSPTVADLNDTSANITITPNSTILTITGNSTVNGTLNGACIGSCNFQLTGSSKTMYGSGTYGGIQITGNHTIDSAATFYLNVAGISSGITLTNNGTITGRGIVGNGNGLWTQGTNASLTWLGGNEFDPILDATASGNIVAYEATGIVRSATYYNLKVGVSSASQVVGTLGGNTTVTNVLTIGGGAAGSQISASSYTLTVTKSGDPIVVGSGGVFTSSTSTVNFTGDGATNINGFSYYNLQIGNATTQTAARTYTLAGNAVVGGTLTIGPSSGSYTHVFDASSRTITLSGTGTIFNMQSKGDFTAGTSTIAITNTASGSKTFAGGGKTYNDLSITAGGSGAVIFSGSNTFDDFTINPPKTVTFTAGTTQTFTGTVSAVGSAGNVITIGSTAASAASLSKSSGTVTADFLNLSYSTATGGAMWYAGCNSTDGGNNSGWLWCESTPDSPEPGQIVVHKTTLGGNGTFSFTTTGNGFYPFNITTTNGSGLFTKSGLSPGMYSATETVPSGWTKTSDNCGLISVSANSVTDCYITNTFNNENPTPTIISISPAAKNEGAPGFTLTVNGINFLPSSTLYFGGLAVQATYISPTKLTYFVAPVPPVGNYSIMVVNPAPGGGTSNTKTFTVNSLVTPTCNPIPIISNIIPSSKNQGDPGFTLTVNGSNFVSASIIYFNGLALTTSYVSPTKVTASISSTPTPGSYYVTVVNPDSGGNNPISGLTDRLPVSVAVSPDGDFAYVVNVGSNWLQKFNSSDISLEARIRTGSDPTDVAVSPDGNFVYVVNKGSNTLQKFNASNLSLAVFANTGNAPTAVAVSPDGNFVYVITPGSNTLFKFSAVNLSLVDSVATGANPMYLAISPNSNFVYVVNKMASTLQKFNASTLGLVASTTTAIAPTYVVASSDGSYVYVGSYFNEKLQKFNASNLTELVTVSLAGPAKLAISPDNNYLYITKKEYDDTVLKFNTSDLTQAGSVQAGSFAQLGKVPYGVAVSPDGSSVYVSNYFGNTLQKFDSSFTLCGGTSNAKVFTVNAPEPGSIKIIKNTSGGDRVFNFTVAGSTNLTPVITTTNGTGETGPTNVNPGAYTITETVPNGWTFNSATCDHSYVSTTNGVANVTVTAGQTTTCTFTNTKNNITPNTFLRINKDASGGNGTFNYTVTGALEFNTSITTVNNTGSTGSTPVSAGTYNITEELPAVWDFDSAGCNNGSGTTGTPTANGIIGVTVIAGQTTTCVFGNTKQTIPPNTYLKIVKNTSGGNATFNYTISGPTNLAPVITTTNGTGISGPTPVMSGTYSITETIPNGWTQTAASCDHGTPSAAQVIAGQTTTCTFSNTKDSVLPGTSIKIVKSALGGDAIFNYTVSGPTNLAPSITTSGGIGASGPTAVNPGTYSISESLSDGWSFSFVYCDKTYSQGQNGATNILVVEGETTTCTFSNINNSVPPQTSLKIIKNTSGGDGTFDYTVTGPENTASQITTSNGVSYNNHQFAAGGTYAITERLPQGWEFTAGFCDHAYAEGTNGVTGVTVTDGETTTCILTNTKEEIPPQTYLKLIKTTSGGNTTFNYTVSGPTQLSPVITTSNGLGVSGPSQVAEGTYSITESVPQGWNFDSAICDHAYSSGTNGVINVTVVANETTTCTFTNTADDTPEIASLKIIKNTINGNGTFEYAVTGPTSSVPSVTTTGGIGSSGVVPVDEGTYAITETVLNGWSFNTANCDHTYSLGTNGVTNVMVVANETTTCTFTNTKKTIPPNTYLKIVKNTSGGNGTFSYVVSGPTPSTPSIVTSNGTGISGPTPAMPGTYSITESVPNGWTQTAAFCDRGTPSAAIVVSGQTTTCTFSNGKNNNGPTIISINPSQKLVGDLPFTMTVNGTGFVPNSVIYFDSFALSTSYVSNTKLKTFIAPVPPEGTYYVSVVNPAPGGGTSNSVPFVVKPLDTDASVYANNLGVSDTACPISQGTSTTYFYWNYQNNQGHYQKQFQIQISDQSNFVMPMVDRTFDNLSNAPGVQNQQTIQVKLTSASPTTPKCDFINFNKTYYWRVKVWEKNEEGGLGNSSEWIVGQPYTTIAHPGPYAAFGFSPPIPAPQSDVFFSNNSICYTDSGWTACASYAWSFGDSGTASQQNPSHAYNSSGNFMATMQAYDDLGTSCQAQKNVPIFNNTSLNGLPFFKEISPFLK